MIGNDLFFDFIVLQHKCNTRVRCKISAQVRFVRSSDDTIENRKPPGYSTCIMHRTTDFWVRNHVSTDWPVLDLSIVHGGLLRILRRALEFDAFLTIESRRRLKLRRFFPFRYEGYCVTVHGDKMDDPADMGQIRIPVRKFMYIFQIRPRWPYIFVECYTQNANTSTSCCVNQYRLADPLHKRGLSHETNYWKRKGRTKFLSHELFSENI